MEFTYFSTENVFFLIKNILIWFNKLTLAHLTKTGTAEDNTHTPLQRNPLKPNAHLFEKTLKWLKKNNFTIQTQFMSNQNIWHHWFTFWHTFLKVWGSCTEKKAHKGWTSRPPAKGERPALSYTLTEDFKNLYDTDSIHCLNQETCVWWKLRCVLLISALFVTPKLCQELNNIPVLRETM